MKIKEKITSQLWGVKLGDEYLFSLKDHIDLLLNGNVLFFFAHSKLDADQTIFFLHPGFQEKDKKNALQTQLSAKAALRLDCKKAWVQFGAMWEYWLSFPSASNPKIEDSSPCKISLKKMHAYSIFLSVTLPL